MEERLLLWVYAVSAVYVIMLSLRRLGAVGLRLPATMTALAGISFAGLFLPSMQETAFWAATSVYVLVLVIPGILVRWARRSARSGSFSRAEILCRIALLLLSTPAIRMEHSICQSLKEGGAVAGRVRLDRAPWASEGAGRATPSTLLLVVAILLYYGIVAFGGSTESPLRLLDFGANLRPLVRGGEAYRLITAMFLHIGLLHLLLNTAAIWILGRWVEPETGGSWILIVFFLGGVAGNLASVAHHGEGALSAGASGGAMALVGCAIALYLGVRARAGAGPSDTERRCARPARRGEEPTLTGRRRGATQPGGMLRPSNPEAVPGRTPRARPGRSARLQSLLFVVAATLLVGELVPGIDNAAHMGGLASGFLLGLLYRRTGRPAAPVARVAAGVLLLVAVGSFVWLGLTAGDWRRPVPFASSGFALSLPACFTASGKGPEVRFTGMPGTEFIVLLEDGPGSSRELLNRQLDEIERAVREKYPESSPEREGPDRGPDRGGWWRGSIVSRREDGAFRHEAFLLRHPGGRQVALIVFSMPDDERLRSVLTSCILESFEFTE